MNRKMPTFLLKVGRFVTVVMAVFILVKFYTGCVYTFKTTIGKSGKDVGGAGNLADLGNMTNFEDFADFFGNTTNITGFGSFTDNTTRLWPEMIQIRMSSFFRKFPDPNFDVADEILIAAWKLPPKTRLSPDMRRIARCVLAAEKKPDFDMNICFAVDTSWPIWMVAVLGFVAIYNSIRLIFGLCFKDETVSFFRLYILALIPSIGFTVVCGLLIFFRNHLINLGFSYTLYGDFNPKPYYFLANKDHDLVLVYDILVYGNYINEFAFFSYYVVCCEWLKCKSIGASDKKVKPIDNDAKPKKMDAVV